MASVPFPCHDGVVDSWWSTGTTSLDQRDAAVVVVVGVGIGVMMEVVE